MGLFIILANLAQKINCNLVVKKEKCGILIYGRTTEKMLKDKSKGEPE